LAKRKQDKTKQRMERKLAEAQPFGFKNLLRASKIFKQKERKSIKV
jgi:hypothetical protein